jgi:hypothetical protein
MLVSADPDPDMVPLAPLVPEFIELLVPEFVVELLRLASLPAPSVPVPAVLPVVPEPVVLEDVLAPARVVDMLLPELVELPEFEFMPVLLLVPGLAPPAPVPPAPCARATPPTARAAAATRVERVYLVAFICFLPESVTGWRLHEPHGMQLRHSLTAPGSAEPREDLYDEP